MKRLPLLFLACAFAGLYSCQPHDDAPSPTPDPAPAPDSTASWNDSLSRGLWARFTFDSSNLHDVSGHNRHLTGFNNITTGNDRNGVAGKALAFNGVNQYALLDSGVNFPAGDFTLAFQMNTELTGDRRIFNKANINNAQSPSLTLGFNSNYPNQLSMAISSHNLCGGYGNFQDYWTSFSGQAINTNQWYNVALVYQNGRQTVYINGNQTSTQNIANNTYDACNVPMYFGIWWLQDFRAFKGRLDNIRLYTRGLSEAEVRYLNSNNL